MSDHLQDPVLGRLDDALNRTMDLERRARAGEHISPYELASEMRSIRDDLIAERRDVLIRRSELDERLTHFLPRQPWQKIGATIGGIAVTVVAGYVGWFVTGGT